MAWLWPLPDCVVFNSRCVFYHPVWFVCLVWYFRHSISFDLLGSFGAFASLEGLDTSVNPIRLLRCAWLVFSCGSLLLWDVLFTGRVPWRLARSILSALIWTGCLCCPLCLTDSRGTNWPSPGSRWTWQAWYSHCRDSFRFSERRRRSAVLPNSRYSSPQQSAISGPVIAQRWWRRRNKVVF